MDNEFTQYTGLVQGILSHENPIFQLQKVLKHEDTDPYILRHYLRVRSAAFMEQWNEETLKIPALLKDEMFMNSRRKKSAILQSLIHVINEHIEPSKGRGENEQKMESLPAFKNIFNLPTDHNIILAVMERNNEWKRAKRKKAYFVALIDLLTAKKLLKPEIKEEVAYKVIYEKFTNEKPDNTRLDRSRTPTKHSVYYKFFNKLNKNM